MCCALLPSRCCCLFYLSHRMSSWRQSGRHWCATSRSCSAQQRLSWSAKRLRSLGSDRTWTSLALHLLLFNVPALVMQEQALSGGLITTQVQLVEGWSLAAAPTDRAVAMAVQLAAGLPQLVKDERASLKKSLPARPRVQGTESVSGTPMGSTLHRWLPATITTMTGMATTHPRGQAALRERSSTLTNAPGPGWIEVWAGTGKPLSSTQDGQVEMKTGADRSHAATFMTAEEHTVAEPCT